MNYDIPFNRPCIVGTEMREIERALASGHISGDGEYTKRCNELLEREVGVQSCMLTTSCTHALEMAALLTNVGPGDRVIVPSFTFVSTAGAFALRGAGIDFADVRADTLNIDVQEVRRLWTEDTRAVVCVHYAGVGCDMEELQAFCRERDMALIEDNAHGLFGRYKGAELGTFGDLATLSFHETKNFTCGEGGALLLNRSDWIERAEILREKGTNRSQFFRGQVDKYTWADLGSSYLPSDVLAAQLFAQLTAREQIQAARGHIWNRYCDELGTWALEQGVRLPHVPEDCEQPFHLFHLLLPTLTDRQSLIGHLREHGILAVFHYLPLHLSPMGRRMGGRPGECPVSEDVSDRLLRLPLFYGMTDEAQTRVIERVKEFRIAR